MQNFYAILAGLLLSAPSFGNDLKNAPPSFKHEELTIVAADFLSSNVSFRVDFEAKTVRAHAKICFQTGERGAPIIDMVPSPKRVVLNGREIDAGLYEMLPYNGREKFPVRVVKQEIPQGRHVVEIEYELEDGYGGLFNVFVSDNWAALRLAFRDAYHNYFERYGPAGLRFDRYPMNLNIELLSNQSGDLEEHILVANGEVVQTSERLWKVSFPSWYNASSFFISFGRKPFREHKIEWFQGVEHQIKLVFLGNTDCLYEPTLRHLRDLESKFGPFPHNQLIVSSGHTLGSTGMEYSGGFGLRKCIDYGVAHELIHNWFGRSVMPKNVAHDFFDEYLAYWGHNGFSRGARVSAAIFQSVDFLLSEKGGVFEGLKAFHNEFKHRVFSVNDFVDFLDGWAGNQRITKYFSEYHPDLLVLPEGP